MPAGHTDFDVAIVGGGIVGLATAMALTETSPRRRLIVCEAEDTLAAHQSGRNSGVIHSGVYYAPGSLKARLCVTGSDQLYTFCDRHEIPTRRCGKVVIATTPAETARLATLADTGRANGLRGLSLLTAEQLREHEPYAGGVAGLFVPQTGVVDYAQVTRAYAAQVRQCGHEVRCGSRVIEVHRGPNRVYLDTTAGSVRARLLIGCTGLQADRFAAMCGVDPGAAIIAFRGQYHRLADDRRLLVRGLIYPAPDPRYPFLGVHLTRHIDDTVTAGPNAVLALKREGYEPWAFSLRDVRAMAVRPAFWAMAVRHWPLGVREMHRALRRSRFVASVQALVPAVRTGDLRPAPSGIRAQAVTLSGRLLDDFHIVQAQRMIHVINAPSPAATASIAIGKYIAAQAATQLDAMT